MGARMVGGEAALEIRVLAKHGLGVREIAREVGVSRNTVRRYLREPEAGRYRGRPPQPGKLAAFEGYVVARVASAVPEQLAASVLLREISSRATMRCLRVAKAAAMAGKGWRMVGAGRAAGRGAAMGVAGTTE